MLDGDTLHALGRRLRAARWWLIILGALAPRLVLSGEEPSPRPNVILCMTDDQGWGDTGYYGHPVLNTPHLDQLARDGIRFDRFYAAAPVCSPTRGSCLTGRHPYRYGIRFANRGRMKAEEITLAEVLKIQGYTTGHFGKWHLGTLTTTRTDSNRGRPGNTAHYAPPWEHGFDVCFSTEAKVPTWDPMVDPETGKPYGTRYWSGPDRVAVDNLEGDDSRVVMDRVVPFIRKAVADQVPFLAVIWFHAPHLPVVAGTPYREMYAGHPGADYLGSLTAMDDQLGRLRGELTRLGANSHTLLWFCSDNGPEGDDRAPGTTRGLRGRKRSLYEGGVRVPGLLVWPDRVHPGRVVTMPCSTSDYLPTILDILGIGPHPADVRPYDGISLLPLIERRMTERPTPIAFESGHQVSLTGNRYKIYSDDDGRTFALYDLIADPGEIENLANRHPDIYRGMKQTLDAWRRSCRSSEQGHDYATASHARAGAD